MTTTARLGKKTLTITVDSSRKVSAVDARGGIYIGDGMAASDGCADVELYWYGAPRVGIQRVGRLIVDKDRAYFA